MIRKPVDWTLVTGGARGLGAEIADALLQMGSSVMPSELLDSLGEQTCAALTAAHPGRVAYVHQDVIVAAD